MDDDICAGSAEERAAYYRKKAEDLRRKAHAFFGALRNDFFRMADQWENLARSVERRGDAPADGFAAMAEADANSNDSDDDMDEPQQA